MGSRKINKIKIIEPFKLLCTFDNNEVRLFEISKNLKIEDKYFHQLLEESNFNKVEIGVFGELSWKELAEIQNYNGELELCEYDMSPEFVYNNSLLI